MGSLYVESDCISESDLLRRKSHHIYKEDQHIHAYGAIENIYSVFRREESYGNQHKKEDSSGEFDWSQEQIASGEKQYSNNE